MTETEILINEIAQDKIEFNEGCKIILENQNFDFKKIFMLLRNYILNSISGKTNYNDETYQNAIHSIPIKQTFTPIIILKEFPTKIAFNKLEELPKSEQEKITIALLWIFKQTDTKRRNTDCQNGCEHDWHNLR